MGLLDWYVNYKIRRALKREIKHHKMKCTVNDILNDKNKAVFN